MLSSSSTMRMIFLARCPYCKESCAPLFICLSFRKTNIPHSIEFPQTYSNILKLRTEGFLYQYANFFVFHNVLFCSDYCSKTYASRALPQLSLFLIHP